MLPYDALIIVASTNKSFELDCINGGKTKKRQLSNAFANKAFERLPAPTKISVPN